MATMRVGAALATLLVLAACGSTTEDRALSGAGVGAAAGTVIGAVTGFGLVHGALVGAGAGALTGALTDEDQINLGRPLWRGEGATGEEAAAPPPQGSPLVRDIQSDLARLGYQPGPADGLIGPRTQGAIRAYQSEYGLTPDGQVTADLAQHIRARVD